MAEINIEKMAQNVAEKTLDEILYQGKSIREWIQIIVSEDSISRQAVMEQTYNWSKDEFLRVTNPFDYLRKRINSLPPVNPQPCPNAISRSDMLDAIGHGTTYTSEELQGIIKGLPSVNSQPKVGHWYVNEWGNITCSECGCTALYDKVYPGESVFGKAIRVKTTFCPTCGARMIESQESEVQE